MTTLVSETIKVFVGLRRLAKRQCEGIDPGDTIEVVKWRPYVGTRAYLGVDVGHIDVKNLRTGKVSTHGACLLGPNFLNSVAPPIPAPTLAPLKLTRRPLKAQTRFEPEKLRNPMLQVHVTQEDIDQAAKAVADNRNMRTAVCIIARAVTRALKARFRRHPDVYATVAFTSFTIRDAKGPVRGAIKLPDSASWALRVFDNWTHEPGKYSAPSPTVFEIGLRTGFGR